MNLPPNFPISNTVKIPITGINIVSGAHGPVIKGENASSSFIVVAHWL
jgi:hypothetical protein